MHEMSVMAGVIEVINNSLKDNNINNVTKVKLVVGQMSNSVPECLTMAFEVMREEGPFAEDAILEIEVVKVRVQCQECECEFQPGKGYIFTCPQCNSLHTEVIEGDKLYIDYIEGDTIDDNKNQSE